LKLGSLVRALGHVRVGQDGRLWRYVDGVYRSDGDRFARIAAKRLLGDRSKRRHADELIAWLVADEITVTDRHPPRFLNVANGLLDPETLELEAHTPDVVSIVQIPVARKPEATCPQIDAFLGQVVPKDAIDFVFEVVGYALLPRNPLRVAILLLGPGRNGKSVLLAIIRALLGTANVSTVPLQVLAESRFAAAELFGKLANVCGDLDARAVKQTDVFKAWTGGDPILAERKYAQPFSFVPGALPIFSANEAPLSSDQTQAWFDRWLLIPMERRIARDQVDPHLARKLTAPNELEGLLVRAVEGLGRVMERGRFEAPASVRGAGERYRDRLDSVRGFVGEACALRPDAWTPRPVIYAAYRRWCSESGRFAVSAVSFNDHVRRSFGEVEERTRRGRRGWLGIGLLVEDEV